MNKIIVLLIFILFNLSCKDTKDKRINISSYKEELNTISNSTVNKEIIKDTLKGICDFRKVVINIESIEYTKYKHKDWMFDNNSFKLSHILTINKNNYRVKTTSYEYKNKVVFYVHTIKHINDTISIKPFLENTQGKKPKGYLQMRDLIFAMKDDKIANFIDIPAKGNSYELRQELLKILYQNIDSDIILCNRTKKCIYKDLRKNKIKGN